jgi:hypothetical protein
LVAFRASSPTRIGPHPQHMISVLTTDLPLLSFHLLMARLPARTRAFRLERRLRFTTPGPFPDPETAALHGLPRVGAAPLSPVEPTISRFSAFGRPSCYGCGPVRAHSAYACSPRGVGTLAGPCSPLCTATAPLPEPGEPVGSATARDVLCRPGRHNSRAFPFRGL